MSLSAASSDANGNLGEPLDVDWVKRVRFGALLLFWTILITPILVNLVGYAMASSLGADYVHYWGFLQLIPTLAGWPLLVGVFALTKPWPFTSSQTSRDRLRRSLRVIICLEILERVVGTVCQMLHVAPDGDWFWLPGHAIGIFGMVVALAHLVFLCRRLGIRAIARSFRTVAVCYVALIAVGLICVFVIGSDLLFNWPPWEYLHWAEEVAWLAVWIWGLVLLRKFAGHLTRGLGGVCIACGYSLKGLLQPRCPECGQALQVQPAPESGRPPSSDLEP